MSNLYKWQDGTVREYAEFRLDADESGAPTYRHGIPCNKCQLSTSQVLRYHHNDECTMCAAKMAGAFATHYHNPKSLLDRKPWYVEPAPLENRRIPWSTWEYWDKLIAEVKDNPSLTVNNEKCRKYGHLGIKTANGHCYECSKMEDPKVTAKKNGEDYYYTYKICSGCGKTTPKSISNDACSTCKPKDPSSSEIEDYFEPDAIVTREEAIHLYKSKRYRTGDPCNKCGIAGWRQTSNYRCLECR